MRILFLSAEVKPFTKVGGLGDVAGSLPAALRTLGHDVRVFTPAHRAIEDTLRRGEGPRPITAIRVEMAGGQHEAGLLEGSLPGTDVPVYFIARRELYDRDRIYGFEDDPWRFAFFCRAVFVALAHLDWTPHAVHANDWHTAPAVSWLARSGDPELGGVPTIFTIHNLAHQGHTGRALPAALGLPLPQLPVEAPGEVNLMAQAIHDATRVGTVSPTYAREILTPPGGAGLDGLLGSLPHPPVGIVNGLDYAEWNPARDANLAAGYGADTLSAREANRTALAREAGFQPDGSPIVVMVSRLDRQKGMDLLPEVVEHLATHPSGARVAILGSGSPEYADAVRALVARHPRRVAAWLDRFDNELAHRLYGGGDLLLVPSLFEPCGLTQLIAMRYGCVPVVRAVGGLADTVDEGRTGFRFDAFDAPACCAALDRALEGRRDRERWARIQRAGMSSDWSWKTSAKKYGELYELAVATRSGR